MAATVRHAHKEDLDAVSGLWAQFARVREGLTGNTLLNQDAQAWFLGYASGLLGRRDALVLVAEDGGGLVGYFIALKQRKPPIYSHTQVGYVSDAFVAESHRGQGILTRFLDELATWCRREAITAVDVQVFAANEQVLELYRRRGFKDYRVLMRLETGQPEAKPAYG